MKKFLLTLAFALPILGFGQALTNKTFDTNISGWVKGAGGASTLIAWDATEGAASAGSLKLTAAQANARVQLSSDALPVSGDGDYVLTYKVKGPVGKKVRADVYNNGSAIIGTLTTLTGGWDTVTKTFTLNNTPTNIRLIATDPDTSAPYSIYYFDDVEWTLQIPVGNTTLATAVTGKGTVTVNPVKSSYLPTDVVSLTPNPATHFVFNNWTGDLTGNSNPASITMDTNKSVTANFGVDPSFNYAFLFNTDGDQEGWDRTTDTNMSVTQSGGIVTLAPTANQFARYSLSGFSIPAANYNKLTIKYKNNSSTTDQLSFVVNNGSASSTSVAGVLQTSTSGFVTDSYAINTNTAWTGSITELRLRFADADNTTSGRPSDAGTIEIDEIIFSYDSTLSTGDINKAKTLVQVYVAENKLNFRNANVTKATVFSMNGQVVKETKVANNNIDISSLKSGVYIVKATAQDGSDTITKFIKK